MGNIESMTCRMDYRSSVRRNARYEWAMAAGHTPIDEWFAQYHARRLPDTSDLEFETEEDAIAFILKFS